MVEARGSCSLKGSQEKQNTFKENKKQKRGRSNNLLMQDLNAIFHEKVKKRKKNVLFVCTSFSDFKKQIMTQ